MLIRYPALWLVKISRGYDNNVYYHEYGSWKPHLDSGTLIVDENEPDRVRGDPKVHPAQPRVEMSLRDVTQAIYEIREHAQQTQEIANAKSDALQNTLNTMNETLTLILAEVRAGNQRNNQVEEGAAL